MTNFSLGWRGTWRWFAVAFILSLLVSASGQSAGIFNTTSSFTNSVFCSLYRCSAPTKTTEKDGSTTWIYLDGAKKFHVTVHRSKGGKVIGAKLNIRQVSSMESYTINNISTLFLETLFPPGGDFFNVALECVRSAYPETSYTGPSHDFEYYGVATRVFCLRGDSVPGTVVESYFPVIMVFAFVKSNNPNDPTNGLR